MVRREGARWTVGLMPAAAQDAPAFPDTGLLVGRTARRLPVALEGRFASLPAAVPPRRASSAERAGVRSASRRRLGPQRQVGRGPSETKIAVVPLDQLAQLEQYEQFEQSDQLEQVERSDQLAQPDQLD